MQFASGRCVAVLAFGAMGIAKRWANYSFDAVQIAAGGQSLLRVARAADSRLRLTSLTAIRVAPAARATIVVTRPIGPAPAISNEVPVWVPALRFAQMPTESGSSRAAALSLISSGTV